jgi:hypothetical protein
MEVASPTAGSVLVEVSQLQLLQACHEVTVRTMSPHGESSDSIPAPVAPALASACQPARMSCLSPRPSPEVRTPLASVSPGLGDTSFPLRHPVPHGTQDFSASLSIEMSKGPQEEPPVPCSQVLVSSTGSLKCKLKEGLEFELLLDAIHCRKRLGQLCGASQKRRGLSSQLWARKALSLWLLPWLSRKWSALQEMLALYLAPPKES